MSWLNNILYDTSTIAGQRCLFYKVVCTIISYYLLRASMYAKRNSPELTINTEVFTRLSIKLP